MNGTDRDTGDYVGILSPARLDVNTGFKLKAIDTRLGVRGQFAAKHDKVNDPAEARDAYETFDIYAAWTPAGALEGLRVDVGVDNLFDRNFERVFAGVSEPGRNVKALISWTDSF